MTLPSPGGDSAISRAAGLQTHIPVTTYLALLGGVTCIAFSGIFVRWADTTGDVATFFRLGIAALVMTLPVLVNWRRGRARLARSALPLALLAGLVFAADSSLFSTAVNLTTAANATLLGNTAPLWVGLAAWLLMREKLGAGYWAGLALALIGVLIIVGLDALRGLGTNLGNLIALGSGLAYGSYQLITQRARSGIDTLTYSWMFSAVGAMLLLGVTHALGHPLTGLPLPSYLALIGLGVVSHVGGWLLINYALGHLRASVVSVTLLMQPVITALVAMPLLGETPQAWHVIGGLVTLAGIYTVHRSFASAAPPS